MPLAELGRRSLTKGLGAFPRAGGEDGVDVKGQLFAQIEEAAIELGVAESEIVRGGLNNGLEESLFVERGRAFHRKRNGGREIGDEVLGSLLRNEDELYHKEGLDRLLREDPERLEGRVFRDASAFCRCCGQYIREAARERLGQAPGGRSGYRVLPAHGGQWHVSTIGIVIEN